jgi:alpha-amylase
MTKLTGAQGPIANAGSDIAISPGELTLFDGSQSYDPDGEIASYEWTAEAFGSTTLSGVGPQYQFSEEGIYTVTLTVTDNDGSTATDTVIVTVSNQTCETNFPQLYIRGTNNSWTTIQMTVNDSCQFEAVLDFGSATDERFKFDVYGNWVENYGDNNNDGIADLTGNDIFITQGAGSYKITFDDSHLNYSITKL